MSTYALALVPPAELALELAAVRARIDPEHAPKTIPHITVKQPFSGDRECLARLFAGLERWCASQPPIALELDALDVFESRLFGSVVHLRGVRQPALDAFHRALIGRVHAAGADSGLLTLEHEDTTFYPHLTLAQGLTPEAAGAALADLRIGLPLTFSASELVVGMRDDDGFWHRPCVFPLAGAGDAVRLSS